MAKVHFGTWMGMSLRVTGKTTKQTGTEYTHIAMALGMKVTGKMTYSTASALNSGLTIPSMKVTTCSAKSTGREPTYGMMEVSTWASGKKTRFMVEELMFG